jgi:hypothetical protein
MDGLLAPAPKGQGESVMNAEFGVVEMKRGWYGAWGEHKNGGLETPICLLDF